MDNETHNLCFEAIPHWCGVQKSPGVDCTLRFALSAESGIQIRQIDSENRILDFIDAYQSGSYSYITNPPGGSDWSNSLGDKCVNLVKASVADGQPKRILEIGGGSTWVARQLLDYYCPNSYSIVDPSLREVAEGVEIIRDYFPSAQIKARTFDLVLAFNVLEHVPDPLAFLQCVRAHLCPGGKVVLAFPDCERQLLIGDPNVLVHEHLSYFTEHSARWLVSVAGFDIMSMTREHDTFYCVLSAASIQSANGREPNEHRLLLESTAAFADLFDRFASTIRASLLHGNKIGFHGATAGLNTFLYVSGLGGNPNVRIYDADHSKHGFYLPASTSQILSPLDRSYSKNDHLIVSAMSFYSQIKDFALNVAGVREACVLPLAGRYD